MIILVNVAVKRDGGILFGLYRARYDFWSKAKLGRRGGCLMPKILGKMSFTEAAHEVLKREKRPLGPKEITDIAIKQKLIVTNSKRPAATMAGRLYSNRGKLFESVGSGRYIIKE